VTEVWSGFVLKADPLNGMVLSRISLKLR